MVQRKGLNKEEVRDLYMLILMEAAMDARELPEPLKELSRIIVKHTFISLEKKLIKKIKYKPEQKTEIKWH